jgi:hypothetical protein
VRGQTVQKIKTPTTEQTNSRCEQKRKPSPEHTIPIATREQLLERAARLRPTFLARQKQRREAELVASQKKEQAITFCKHRKELDTLMAAQKKARGGTPPGPFQNMLWDLLVTLTNTRITGNPEPLLNLLTKIVGRASKEQAVSTPLTKYIDVMLVLAGAKKELAEDHDGLPNF